MLRDLEAGELKYKSEEQNVFRFGEEEVVSL